MVWERVKKEMTLTRVLLALVAILLCCYLTFGLPHKSEEKQDNNEHGTGMLNMIRNFIEGNDSQSETSTGSINDTTEHNTRLYDVTKTSSKPRKFYSVSPPIKKINSESMTKKDNILDISEHKPVTPSAQPTNASSNETDSEVDFIIVFGGENATEPESEANPQTEQEQDDSQILDVEHEATDDADEVMTNHILYTKTIRISKIEEVFEDLVAQNIRRVIKEDRVERVEVSKNEEMEKMENEFGIKHLLSS